MHRSNVVIVPSQLAANGALDLYIDGCRKDDVPQMLIGLKVLRDASAAQLDGAFAFAEQRHGLTSAEVLALLAR